jgi:hypothetical protein
MKTTEKEKEWLEVEYCPCCSGDKISYTPGDQEYHCGECGAAWNMVEFGEQLL